VTSRTSKENYELHTIAHTYAKKLYKNRIEMDVIKMDDSKREVLKNHGTKGIKDLGLSLRTIEENEVKKVKEKKKAEKEAKLISKNQTKTLHTNINNADQMVMLETLMLNMNLSNTTVQCARVDDRKINSIKGHDETIDYLVPSGSIERIQEVRNKSREEKIGQFEERIKKVKECLEKIQAEIEIHKEGLNKTQVKIRNDKQIVRLNNIGAQREIDRLPNQVKKETPPLFNKKDIKNTNQNFASSLRTYAPSTTNTVRNRVLELKTKLKNQK
jgi:hypothetical protein